MRDRDLGFFQNELVRVSGWIESADQKAAFLGVFYSGILLFLLTQKGEITKFFIYAQVGDHIFLKTLILTVFLLFFLRGALNLFGAVSPGLVAENSKTNCFFFGNVAAMSKQDFLNQISGMKDDEITRNLIEQIYVNSRIADKKMKHIKNAIECLFLAAISLAIFIFLL